MKRTALLGIAIAPPELFQLHDIQQYMSREFHRAHAKVSKIKN